MKTINRSGTVFAQSEPDRFYLPQPDQPFEGKVDTRIGTLEFSNQYPNRESLDMLLDNMDFHGATQAYLWGIPIASNANLQYYLDDIFKVRQGELVKTTSLDEKRGILTANATTPYIFTTVNLVETGPFVVELPPGATAGLVDDFWQRPVTDLGLPGPDKGQGAKYLITPPGHAGEKPSGYRVVESPTNNVFIGIRLLDADPDKANDLAKRSTDPYWPGTNWKLALGLEPSQRQENYDELDERAEWFYEAVTVLRGYDDEDPGRWLDVSRKLRRQGRRVA